jgi:diacylglycerol kinase (ATP)
LRFTLMAVLILHNPSAGAGRLSREALLQMFHARAEDVLYRDVKKEGIDARAAALADLIVVAGGDGTVGRVMRALDGVTRPLLILPLGTANNVARALGLPRDPEAILQACASWTTRRVDLGLATGPFGQRPFIEGVGIGALAAVIAAGDARKMTLQEEHRFGRDMPGVIVQRARAHKWQAMADGQPLPDELLLLYALNVPLIGPALPLGEAARPDDGCLEVVYLRPQHRHAFVGWLNGDRSGLPAGLERLRARRVSFDWTSGPLAIDDHLPAEPDRTRRIILRLGQRHLDLLAPAPAAVPKGD